MLSNKQGKNTFDEASRMMTICNACRYCEGHCAVFKAMEFRLEFNNDTLEYMANLCHNCGSCFHHCQYTAPHEFDVNIPAVFASLRQENYASHAWPGFMGGLFKRSAVWTATCLMATLTAFFLLITLYNGQGQFFTTQPDAFYGLIPHTMMAGIFGGVSIFVAFAIASGLVGFWNTLNLPNPFGMGRGVIMQAIKDALSLKYLDGGKGQGCTYPTEKPSLARRCFHQLTFWGFMLCFAATSVGTLYHYGFNLTAPYNFISLPKLLGTLGGLGLLIGPAGLFILKKRANPATQPSNTKTMDVTFIGLLFLISATGFLLMFFKNTPWLGATLCTHLAAVMTLFLSMPYGKFMHGFYRIIALIGYALEMKEKAPHIGNKPVMTVAKE